MEKIQRDKEDSGRYRKTYEYNTEEKTNQYKHF